MVVGSGNVTVLPARVVITEETRGQASDCRLRNILSGVCSPFVARVDAMADVKGDS
jgi:hypothetical protein